VPGEIRFRWRHTSPDCQDRKHDSGAGAGNPETDAVWSPLVAERGPRRRSSASLRRFRRAAADGSRDRSKEYRDWLVIELSGRGAGRPGRP